MAVRTSVNQAVKERIRIIIRGAVQGVGFRPFVYRLAADMGLSGWISNSLQGVMIEVEGPQEELRAFVLRIEREKPPLASIQSLEYSVLDPAGFDQFVIRPSIEKGGASALMLPDIATCADCRREIFDPTNRRYRYAFTNCTHCGPRFSIIESLPYDRPRTSMKKFSMCPRCREEYENPEDRRFHAQPNACPECGPHLQLWNGAGQVIALRHDALLATASALQAGQLVAVKGLGGFHLMADGRNEDAVARLRARKHREEKPLALMFPSLKSIRGECEISDLEERLLVSPESPIVLLHRKTQNSASAPAASEIAPQVAPGNPYLGVMLPYTPLHHLLMAELGFPVVATSGNLSDEPICTDEREALCRLAGIADLFLVHDRPILRHVDDSVARVVEGRELVLRRSRGYAPLPVSLAASARQTPAVLAVGAHLKNSIALNGGDGNVFISQHIGDLETKEAWSAFCRVISDFERMYGVSPAGIACDLHPDYASTEYARSRQLPLVPIQHHFAHVAACMAENGIEGQVLGIAWDGTGYGPDGTVWGGEFLLTQSAECDAAPATGMLARRIASFRQFPLPGGEQAIREPRRSALGLLYALYGPGAFERDDLPPLLAFSSAQRFALRQLLLKRLNSPLTSSAGRLFDAVASLLGLRHEARFEGQAAMELEFAASDFSTNAAYPFRVLENNSNASNKESDGLSVSSADSKPQASPEIRPQLKTEVRPAMWIDWQPAVEAILFDRGRCPAGAVARQFHNMLAEVAVAVARQAGEERVVLTGGCFQNKVLLERTISELRAAGFRPYWHQRVPPNDGGIALGQAAVAMALAHHSPSSSRLASDSERSEEFALLAGNPQHP